jgi:hypothetical protein
MEKWYVIADIFDSACQGSEHDTYEDAQRTCVDLQKKGHPNARIVGPDCEPQDDFYSERYGDWSVT